MSTRPEYLTYRLEGMNLIEAAAGTGKTYTIQNLVVRFLLERQLPIRSLLVVTFTEAATAELRERIRTAKYQPRIRRQPATTVKPSIYSKRPAPPCILKPRPR